MSSEFCFKKVRRNFPSLIILRYFPRCNSTNGSGGLDTHDDLSPTVGDHDDPFAIDYGLDFYAYLTPIIIVVGLFGNSVSLCIFKRRTIRKLSASVYLSAICVSDICVLFFILLDWLNKGLPRIGASGVRVPIVLRQGCCQAFLFFSYTFRIISVWLIIVFTFERYISLPCITPSRKFCTWLLENLLLSEQS